MSQCTGATSQNWESPQTVEKPGTRCFHEASKMEDNPFPGLQISSAGFLNDLQGRQLCPRCQKSRKYYCYNCFVPVQGTEDKVPRVKLPIKIDIIKHPNECDGKSTSAHAAVLAPESVKVYTYPVIPDYTDPEKILLVFPGEKSVTLQQLHQQKIKQCPKASGNNRYKETNKYSETETLTSDKESLAKASLKDNTSESVPQKISAEDCSLEVNSRTEDCSCTEESAISHSDKEGVVKKDFSADRTTATEQVNSASEQTSGESGQKRTLETEEDEPCKKSKTGDQELELPFERVVFIDSTWNQTKKIFMDERLRGFQQVELHTYKTKFWRHQRDKPECYLSTIEAIYFFLREFHEAFLSSEYQGQYDNLLFYFLFMYNKIRVLYDGGKDLQAYKQAMNREGM